MSRRACIRDWLSVEGKIIDLHAKLIKKHGEEFASLKAQTVENEVKSSSVFKRRLNKNEALVIC